MAKPKTKASNLQQTKASNLQPTFLPAQMLGAGIPFIVTDQDGTVWRIDPETGIAVKVTFQF